MDAKSGRGGKEKKITVPGKRTNGYADGKAPEEQGGTGRRKCGESACGSDAVAAVSAGERMPAGNRRKAAQASAVDETEAPEKNAVAGVSVAERRTAGNAETRGRQRGKATAGVPDETGAPEKNAVAGVPAGESRTAGNAGTRGRQRVQREKKVPAGTGEEAEPMGKGDGAPLRKMPERNARGRFVKGNNAAEKYREEYGERMLEYFKSSRAEVPYPTFEEFAESLGVTMDTLLNWADKYDRFRNCYARAKNIQKGITIQGGMIGMFNQNIVKFMAINNFGMVEKVETENKLRFEITMPAEIDEESD